MEAAGSGRERRSFLQSCFMCRKQNESYVQEAGCHSSEVVYTYIQLCCEASALAALRENFHREVLHELYITSEGISWPLIRVLKYRACEKIHILTLEQVQSSAVKEECHTLCGE